MGDNQNIDHLTAEIRLEALKLSIKVLKENENLDSNTRIVAVADIYADFILHGETP